MRGYISLLNAESFTSRSSVHLLRKLRIDTSQIRLFNLTFLGLALL